MNGKTDNDSLSYRLYILVARRLRFVVGALGMIELAPGCYVYTGSAHRRPLARLRRHLSRDKRLRWHIDYLLVQPGVQIVDLTLHREAECAVNRATGGEVPVPGFGASDCRAGCGSHLRRLSKHRIPFPECRNIIEK